MCNEIHLNEYIDYKVGVNYSDNSCVSSARVWVVKCVLSKLYILPVKAFSGEALYLFLRKVILIPEGI